MEGDLSTAGRSCLSTASTKHDKNSLNTDGQIIMYHS